MSISMSMSISLSMSISMSMCISVSMSTSALLYQKEPSAREGEKCCARRKTVHFCLNMYSLYLFRLYLCLYLCLCLCLCLHSRIKKNRALNSEITAKSVLSSIIGLFCKRALQKKLYSAKETHKFKEPTNCERSTVRLLLCKTGNCKSLSKSISSKSVS